MMRFEMLRALCVGTIVMVACTARAEGGQAGPDGWVGDLTPISAQDWDRDKAAHLLERAGFGRHTR